MDKNPVTLWKKYPTERWTNLPEKWPSLREHEFIILCSGSVGGGDLISDPHLKQARLTRGFNTHATLDAYASFSIPTKNCLDHLPLYLMPGEMSIECRRIVLTLKRESCHISISINSEL